MVVQVLFTMNLKRTAPGDTNHSWQQRSCIVNFSTFLFNLDLTRQVSKQIIIYNDGLLRPNPDDAGPIVRCPMELPITAGCDTAWIRTRYYSDASCTEMQCLRPLRHSGAYSFKQKADVFQH